jgi:hypothetical protein
VVGRDRNIFLDRDPWPVATGFLNWIATHKKIPVEVPNTTEKFYQEH